MKCCESIEKDPNPTHSNCFVSDRFLNFVTLQWTLDFGLWVFVQMFEELEDDCEGCVVNCFDLDLNILFVVRLTFLIVFLVIFGTLFLLKGLLDEQ